MKAVVKTCLFLLKMIKCGKNSINVIKDKLGIKFHSESIYENKYLKAKVGEFHGAIKTNFLGNHIGNQKKLCIMFALLA